MKDGGWVCLCACLCACVCACVLEFAVCVTRGGD